MTKLKTGMKKGKVKKYAPGGPVSISNINLSKTFSDETGLTALKSKLAPGPSAAKTAGAGIPYSDVANAVGNGVNSIFDSAAERKENIDSRTNPLSSMRSADNLRIGGKMAGNTIKGAGLGATIGSAVPVIGTGVGAVVGGAIAAAGTAIKSGLESKKHKADRLAKLDNFTNTWNGEYSKGLSSQGFAEGGPKDPQQKTKQVALVEDQESKKNKGQEKPKEGGYGATVSTSVPNFQNITRSEIIMNLINSGALPKDKTISEFGSMTPEEIMHVIDSSGVGDMLRVVPKEVKRGQKPGYAFQKSYPLMSATTSSAADSTGYQLVQDISRKNIINDEKLNFVLPKSYKKVNNFPPSGKAEGGLILGKGGPKDDKITKKVEDGSFIIPAENADVAMQIGKEYLEWDGNEQANRSYPGSKVKLSNGEVLFTPEEVSVLRYHNVDIDSLAPNAENSGEAMKRGGEKATTKKYDDGYAAYSKQYIEANPNATDEEVERGYDAFLGSVNSGVRKYGKEKTERPEGSPKVFDYIPEIAGAIQASAGIAGTIKAGAMPDINVSESLKQLVADQRTESQYGLEPGTKAAMNAQAEEARRDTTNAIVNRGGSSSEIMSNLQGVLSTTINKKFDIELADASEKLKKKQLLTSSVGALAGQEMETKKAALENWKSIQDANGTLLSAGISNIVGARKLKAEMEAMKKIGSSSPSFITK